MDEASKYLAMRGAVSIPQSVDAAVELTLRGFKDEDLIYANLDVMDPESLPGLFETAPEFETASVEYSYNVKARGRKARCVYYKHQNHYVGVVVAYPSGIRCLVGRDCALKHFGAEFRVDLDDHDKLLERKSLLLQRKALRNISSLLSEEIAKLNHHNAVVTFIDLRKRWRTMLGPIWTKLHEVASGDKMLRMESSIRDREAEDQRNTKLGISNSKSRKRAENRGGGNRETQT